MFKVIIAGERDFNLWQYDNSYLNKIDYYLRNKSKDKIEMVTGGDKGACQIPFFYEVWHGYKINEFPAYAYWDKYGHRAGFVRNEQMAKYSDALIAFWDRKSEETKHMIDLAEKYNLLIRIINY